jgi:flagellar basal-body rod modification protein FlgD
MIKFVDRSSKEKLDKDGFLKILTSQLTNQDPFNPMDQKQMTGELAQMSSLEQMTNMNSKLDKIAGNPLVQNQFFGASFLGKEISSLGTTVDLKGEEGAEVPIYLPMDAKELKVRITDAKGQLIKDLIVENVPKGGHYIKWDGTKEDGKFVGKGTYNVSVMGKNHSMESFNGETRVKGTVTGVHIKNGELVLRIDGDKQVFLKDVESFSMPGAGKIEGQINDKKPIQQFPDQQGKSNGPQDS